MCFSATASFTASAVLGGVGVVTLKKTKKVREVPFASLPFLFGVQQGIEGVIWLSFQYGSAVLNQIATYSFVSFAYVLWPILVPMSVGLIEPDPMRKKILYAFQVLGIAIGAYFLYFLVTQPVDSRIVCNSLWYASPKAHIVPLVGAYIVAVCASCLFSSHRLVNVLGVLAVVFLGVSYHFFVSNYASVWCFFAALLSAIIYLHFRNRK